MKFRDKRKFRDRHEFRNKNTEITKKHNSNVIGEVNNVMIPVSTEPGIEPLVFRPIIRDVKLANIKHR
jgi:hypothetical protein